MPRRPAPLIRSAWLRATRPTARLRLTLLYGALFLLSGAALLAVTYVLAAHAAAVVTLGKATGAPAKPASPPPAPHAVANHIVHLTNSQLANLQAQITHRHNTAMHELFTGSGLTLAGLTVISLALGWLVAGRVLRPVRTISATARQIGASNLHERLSLDGPDDEFRELAATLDNLLERLQASFDSQRRFVANASHELRTPLTLDRALLERALRNRAPTQAFWRATCERLLASSKQQDRLIEALLALARSEGALNRQEPFELGAVIDSVLLSPELDTANAGLHIQTHTGAAPVSGDRRLVERLVRNLVDNAIRYNQPAGRVDIATATQPGRTVLIVANTGPAIPAADIDRLFQPFQRLTPNRPGHANGTGLGLSIAKAIADAHNATITAAPQPHGGLEIQVSFPACREQERAPAR